MGSFCPECKSNDLITDFIESKVEIVCNDCGAIIGNTLTFASENESNASIRSENPAGLTVLIDEPLNVFEGEHVIEDEIDENSRSSTGTSGSSDRRTCHLCHGNNIAIELVGDSEQLVCLDCGYFVEEQHLISGGDYAPIPGKGDAVYTWTRAPKPKHARDNQLPPQGKVIGIEVTRNVCSQLRLRRDLQEQAVSLFEKMYNTKTGSLRAHSKDNLSVACAYVVARQNGIHVTIQTLRKIHPCNMRFLHKYIKHIVRETKKPLHARCFNSLVNHALSGGNFTSSFIDKVTTLVTVMEKGYLAQGRDYSLVIASVAYLLYISEDVLGRQKTKFSQFCDRIGVSHGQRQPLVTLIKDLLIKLANQLPWVRKEVTRATVLFYMNDIIKYNRSVISRANNYSGVSGPSVSHQSHLQIQNENGAENTTNHRLPGLIPPSMMKSSKNVDVDSLMKSDEGLPDNFDRSVLDQTDLGETEFDDEISQYLLSPEEVEVKREVLQLK